MTFAPAARKPGGEFHGDFRRGGEEDDVEAVFAGRLGSGRNARGTAGAAGGRAVGRVGAVFHEEGRGAAVVLENLDEFGAGVAPEADNARFDHFVFQFTR
jgi:hypothetical protein